MQDWQAVAQREDARVRDGLDRLPDDADARQRQLTRIGNAAYGAGLARLMTGDGDAARSSLLEAARAYRESWELAPAGSWGRPIGMVKAHLLAEDADGARRAAELALERGAAGAESPIGRYAAVLALLVLGRDADARPLADALRTHDAFPQSVGDALAYLAGDDPLGYDEAVREVLDSFERRDEYLEDVRVADTVLVLQALARARGIVVELTSPVLPVA